MTTAVASESMSTLARRVARLEAIESIRLLKARYAALADAKYTTDYQRQPDPEMRRIARLQAECFTEGAVWAAGEGFGRDLVGRAALEQWFQHSPWCFAVHFYSSPILEINGNTAHGTWRLWQLAMRADTRAAVLLAAVTQEGYCQQADGSWLCEAMRFTQLHMTALGDRPDVLAGTFAMLDQKRQSNAETTGRLDADARPASP
jgi:hypothetical protein